MNQMQHNKIRGVLYGVAVGDALGAPVEFMSAGEIGNRFGRITEMVGGGWLGVRPGEITDDTQMTLCVARGIVEAPENPVEAIGAKFIKWMRSGPKDIGSTCGMAIRNAMEHGDSPGYDDWMDGAAKTHVALGGRSGGNGSLMRTAYIPCYYSDEETIRKQAGDISSMTHHDRAAAEACEIYCRIIARMLNRRDYTTRWEVFRREVGKTRYRIAMEPHFTPNPTGYVVESFLAAIWSIRQATWMATNFRQAVETAVNLGGDADTIGAITGGLVGALCGYNRIPESWVNALDEGLRHELDRLAFVADEARERRKHDLDNAKRR